jgi:hypothetical protein
MHVENRNNRALNGLLHGFLGAGGSVRVDRTLNATVPLRRIGGAVAPVWTISAQSSTRDHLRSVTAGGQFPRRCGSEVHESATPPRFS